MYVIVGATGNTGSVLAEKLLAQGEKVRAIGRNKEKLATAGSQGRRSRDWRSYRRGFFDEGV